MFLRLKLKILSVSVTHSLAYSYPHSPTTVARLETSTWPTFMAHWTGEGVDKDMHTIINRSMAPLHTTTTNFVKGAWQPFYSLSHPISEIL